MLERKELVQRIQHSLDSNLRVLIEAPPASNAVYLTVAHIRSNNPEARILHFSALDVNHDYSFEALMRDTARAIFPKEISMTGRALGPILNMFDYVFIEDAQRLFKDNMHFVERLIKHHDPTSTRHTKIALVASLQGQCCN
jgi:hypothetical protein